MRYFIWFLLLLLSTGPAAYAFAHENLEISGYFDSRHSYQIKSPNKALSSETRLRIEGRAYKENASLFASVNVTENHLLEDESGTELHEGYLDCAASSWDIRIGKQIIIWGNSDGLQITDIVSPLDLTESVTRDFDETRMPVEAVKFRWLGNILNGEFLFLPFFKKGEMAEGDEPWAVGKGLSQGTAVTRDEAIEPEKKLSNAEYGGKLSFFLPGFDLALSCFHTWSDFPTQFRTVEKAGSEPGGIRFMPEHKRLDFIGLEFSKPWSELVLRGEAAFFDGTYFEPELLSDAPKEKKSIKWLAGADWYPGSDWTVSVQASETAILDHEGSLKQKEHSYIHTLNIQKKLFREKLAVSNMIYYTPDTDDIYNRLELDLEIADGLHIYSGADIFSGDKNGTYGKYRDNSQVNFRIRYSF